MKIGLLFVCHGSTSRSYMDSINEIVTRVVRKLSKMLGEDKTIVWRVGYLHDVEPRPRDALQQLIAERPDAILIVSLFVVPGRHAGEDVPEMLGIKLGETKYVEGIPVKYVGPLWPDDRIVDIIVDKVTLNLKEVSTP